MMSSVYGAMYNTCFVMSSVYGVEAIAVVSYVAQVLNIRDTVYSTLTNLYP